MEVTIENIGMVVAIIFSMIIIVVFIFRYKSKDNESKYPNKLKDLIDSDRYKNSKFVIVKINDSYGLKFKNQENRYVDLESNGFSRYVGEKHFGDCVGSVNDVIRAFNYKVPEVFEIKSYEEL